MSIEISLVTNCLQRGESNHFTASSKQSCQKTENEAAAYEGKVEGGGGLKKMLGGG